MSELIKTGGCGHFSDKFTCLDCSQSERDALKAEVARVTNLLEMSQLTSKAEISKLKAELAVCKAEQNVCTDNVIVDQLKAELAYFGERHEKCHQDIDLWKSRAAKYREGLANLVLWYAGNLSLPNAIEEAKKLLKETE